jgi:hypothetical protein
MTDTQKRPFLDLPPDVRGVAAGSAYRPFLLSGHSNTKGTSESIPGIKTGRGHELLSQHEVRAFYLLHFNTRIIDIREQYPAFSRDLLTRMSADPEYVPRRTEVPTFDFVLTIADADGKPYRTAVLNIKEAKELSKPAVMRRFLRERQFCHDLGWSWHIVTENDMDNVTAKNARRLYEWIVPKEMESATPDAFRVANWFVQNINRHLDLTVLQQRCAIALQIPQESMTHVFALACYLGFISPQMSKPLELTRPLLLKASD